MEFNIHHRKRSSTSKLTNSSRTSASVAAAASPDVSHHRQAIRSVAQPQKKSSLVQSRPPLPQQPKLQTKPQLKEQPKHQQNWILSKRTTTTKTTTQSTTTSTTSTTISNTRPHLSSMTTPVNKMSSDSQPTASSSTREVNQRKRHLMSQQTPKRPSCTYVLESPARKQPCMKLNSKGEIRIDIRWDDYEQGNRNIEEDLRRLKVRADPLNKSASPRTIFRNGLIGCEKFDAMLRQFREKLNLDRARDKEQEGMWNSFCEWQCTRRNGFRLDYFPFSNRLFQRRR